MPVFNPDTPPIPSLAKLPASLRDIGTEWTRAVSNEIALRHEERQLERRLQAVREKIGDARDRQETCRESARAEVKK